MKDAFRGVRSVSLSEIAEAVGWVVLTPCVLALMLLFLMVGVVFYPAKKWQMLAAHEVMIGRYKASFCGLIFRHLAVGVIVQKSSKEPATDPASGP